MAGKYSVDPTTAAVTFNCDFTGPGGAGFCDPSGTAHVAVWSEIFFIEERYMTGRLLTTRPPTGA